MIISYNVFWLYLVPFSQFPNSYQTHPYFLTPCQLHVFFLNIFVKNFIHEFTSWIYIIFILNLHHVHPVTSPSHLPCAPPQTLTQTHSILFNCWFVGGEWVFSCAHAHCVFSSRPIELTRHRFTAPRFTVVLGMNFFILSGP